MFSIHIEKQKTDIASQKLHIHEEMKGLFLILRSTVVRRSKSIQRENKTSVFKIFPNLSFSFFHFFRHSFLSSECIKIRRKV